MSQIRDAVFERAMEMMSDRFPELVGSTPQWPRVDHFRLVYTAMDSSRTMMEQSIAQGNLQGAITGICEMIGGLQAMAICMGVDTRPIVEAIHRERMGMGAGNIDEVIRTILEFQKPLHLRLESISS